MSFGKRFYVVTLIVVLRKAHTYATRYQAQLSTSLTAPQYTCLVSTIQALADCLAIILPPEPIP